jgi:hypothetical protein
VDVSGLKLKPELTTDAYYTAPKAAKPKRTGKDDAVFAAAKVEKRKNEMRVSVVGCWLTGGDFAGQEEPAGAGAGERAEGGGRTAAGRHQEDAAAERLLAKALFSLQGPAAPPDEVLSPMKKLSVDPFVFFSCLDRDLF